MSYDCIIIGAGVSGCASARELAKYKVNALVLDAAEDVCCGTSKANSAIVHAGFDCEVGSLMAKLNVEGNDMIHELAKDLDIPFNNCGSIVVCLNEEDMPKLQALYDRGIANGVKDLHIITDKAEIKKIEPNLSDDACAILYAKTAGIICPFNLTYAFAENAAVNGIKFQFDTKVEKLEKTADGWKLHTNNGTFDTKVVVNAAGVYADELHNQVCADKIHITPRRGEYILMDKTVGNHCNTTVFPLPGKYGKGILVTPTVHGNLLAGPTAIDLDDKEATNTSPQGLAEVMEHATLTVKNVPFNKAITSFGGLRAHEDGHEFIIGEPADAPGYVDCSGIESPGLTSSPAIGKMVADIVSAKLSLEANPDFVGTRKGILDPKELSFEERQKLIKEQPEYGQIICRCEKVSKGEILDAIRRPLGARTVDGIKRRTRAGMGRCQAGFCTPRVLEILNEECGIPMDQIQKSGPDSKFITGKKD